MSSPRPARDGRNVHLTSSDGGGNPVAADGHAHKPLPEVDTVELPVEQQILIGLGIGIAGGLLGPMLVPIPI